MASEGSVTRWFRQLLDGDTQAVNELWDRFFVQMTNLARTKLGTHAKTIADEEDIALSAFHSLWRGAQRGMFADIADRNELWRLLSKITRRKVLDQMEFEHRQKRDVSRHTNFADDSPIPNVEDLADHGPTPDQVVQFEEQIQNMMQLLPSEEYVKIALLRFEGATIPEIAAQLDRGHATIERKLKAIRKIWEE